MVRGPQPPRRKQLVHPSPNLFAVGEEPVQLLRRRQHLRTRLHQLQQVSPRLVQAVLPLGNGGSVRVAAFDHFIGQLVDLLQPLLAQGVSLTDKLAEGLLENLQNINTTVRPGQRLPSISPSTFRGMFWFVAFYLLRDSPTGLAAWPRVFTLQHHHLNHQVWIGGTFWTPHDQKPDFEIVV